MIAPLWIITAGALTLLHAAGAPRVTPTWEPGKDTLVVGSVSAAKAAATGWKAIVADVEKWRFTTAYDQAHPVRAIRTICRIAHAAHEQCIAAPALDLFGGKPARYLASGVTRAARYADVWEIQAQSLELQPRAYRAFVVAVKRQAVRANPKIRTLAGLTTSRRVGNVTGPKLWTAFTSVRRNVSGYWANVPRPGPWCPDCGAVNPKPMVYVLKRLAAS